LDDHFCDDNRACSTEYCSCEYGCVYDYSNCGCEVSDSNNENDGEDTCSDIAGEYAVYMPNVGTFSFVGEPDVEVELDLFRITGQMTDDADGVFDFVFEFSGLIDTIPPEDRIEYLFSVCYASEDNPEGVDPESWLYYTELTGSLTAPADTYFAGAIIKLTRFGPPAHVGFGANQKNVFYGLGSWIVWEVEEQPDDENITIVNPHGADDHGDILINVKNCDIFCECEEGCPLPCGA